MFDVQHADPLQKKAALEEDPAAKPEVQQSPAAEASAVTGPAADAAPVMGHWADAGVQKKDDDVQKKDDDVQMKGNAADGLISLFEKSWSSGKGLNEAEYNALVAYAKEHEMGDFDRGRVVAGFNKVTSGGGILGFLKGSFDRSGAGKGTLIFNCVINGESYQQMMERMELGA